MASTPPVERHVVSLDIHEDKSTVLTLRANGQWIYAEANPKDLERKTIHSQYCSLVDAYSKQRASEDEAMQSVSSDDDGEDSGYASEEGEGAGKHTEQEHQIQDAEQVRRDWMLQAVNSICNEVASRNRPMKELSLSEWYNNSAILLFTCYVFGLDVNRFRSWSAFGATLYC